MNQGVVRSGHEQQEVVDTFVVVVRLVLADDAHHVVSHAVS